MNLQFVCALLIGMTLHVSVQSAAGQVLPSSPPNFVGSWRVTYVSGDDDDYQFRALGLGSDNTIYVVRPETPTFDILDPTNVGWTLVVEEEGSATPVFVNFQTLSADTVLVSADQDPLIDDLVLQMDRLSSQPGPGPNPTPTSICHGEPLPVGWVIVEVDLDGCGSPPNRAKFFIELPTQRTNICGDWRTTSLFNGYGVVPRRYIISGEIAIGAPCPDGKGFIIDLLGAAFEETHDYCLLDGTIGARNNGIPNDYVITAQYTPADRRLTECRGNHWTIKRPARRETVCTPPSWYPSSYRIVRDSAHLAPQCYDVPPHLLVFGINNAFTIEQIPPLVTGPGGGAYPGPGGPNPNPGPPTSTPSLVAQRNGFFVNDLEIVDLEPQDCRAIEGLRPDEDGEPTTMSSSTTAGSHCKSPARSSPESAWFSIFSNQGNSTHSLRRWDRSSLSQTRTLDVRVHTWLPTIPAAWS